MINRMTRIFASSSVRILTGVGLVLLIPLIAMMFTNEVNWSASDFIIMAVLLVGAGFAFDFARKRVDSRYRLAVAVLVVAIVLFIWGELAVGIVGSPFAGQ